MKHPTTPHPTARRLRGPLALVVLGALALPLALAQPGAGDGAATAPGARPAPDGAWNRGAAMVRRFAGHDGFFMVRRGPDGTTTMLAGPGGRAPGARGDAAGLAERAEGAFARWLEADGDAGPLVPGLTGRVEAGTTVRLTFYAGAPAEGGAEVASLVFVGAETDVASFREQVRAAADGASHAVVDVLGRTVALSTATEDAAE